MSTLRRVTFGLLAGLLTIPAAARAQGALPSGRAVIDKFIAAVGGRDAIMRQSGRHVTGTLEVKAQGVMGTLEVYAAPPNKLVAVINIPGLGEIRRGFDGTVGWSVNPATGPMVMSGRELDQMKHEVDFYNVLYSPAQISNLETVGDTTFEERPAYTVKVTTTWGEEYVEFFDKETGLQLGSIRKQASPMGEMEATTVAGDWHTVEGMKIAYRAVARVMGIEQVVTIKTLEPVAVPDSVFALPKEIQVLVGK